MGCILEVSLFWNYTTWVGSPKEAYYLKLRMLHLTFLGAKSLRLPGTDRSQGDRNQRTTWTNGLRTEAAWPSHAGLRRNVQGKGLKGAKQGTEWQACLINITYHYNQDMYVLPLARFPQMIILFKKEIQNMHVRKRIYCIVKNKFQNYQLLS